MADVWTPPAEPRTRADNIRALIGDTDPDDPQILDLDLAYYLAREPTSDERAAWRVCFFLVGKYARIGTEQKVGPLMEKAQERVENYLRLGQVYWDLAQGGGGESGGAGGPAAKARRTADVEPFFTRANPR